MSQNHPPKGPVVLIIRDGWGHNPNHPPAGVDAVTTAATPVADRIARDYPRTFIRTDSMDVGLPEETMGNSEVGHQNIGAGRIVDQESVRITRAVRDGKLPENETLVAACDHVKEKGSSLHLFGIVSDAGVHGLLEHLYGVLDLAKGQSVQPDKVFIHAFTDGRDTPRTMGKGYVKEVAAKCDELGIGRIASVVGRYYAMDRDNRWGRVQEAYDLLTGREDAPSFPDAATAVAGFYETNDDPNRKGDEFVTPRTIGDAASSRVQSGDAVIFYNYRGDRPRELTKAFVMDDFDGFDRGDKLDLHFVTMTAYEAGLPVEVAFPKPPKMSHILGDYVSSRGLRQFRCAETEKFPHVTFFFNDYREEPFEGEERQIVPSPKDVTTYDQKPEMSSVGVTEETVKRVEAGGFDLIVVNFANGDMVGHTGNFDAAVKACEAVDVGVGKILDAVANAGGRAIVTADHGNADQMTTDGQTGGPPHTAHTLYPVELVVVSDDHKGHTLRDGGRLADVAPTLLDLMSLDKPEAMTGESLLRTS
ncbi:MAG: 2,3-bisphosphoglycerate-independent phosphoglycerate mutase [Planctomycetota bacterium]